ncbi:MAG: metallophosphoesterase [Verrucomicrobia bacterium]|nr:metallophosphoesterase [Verrucomicrobiota bacterium]MBV8481674.1 metallophosphoesterase [Verrucomicrobiota bacterium]
MDTRTGVTRREFLRRSLITAAGLATGVSAATVSSEQTSSSESLRLVFATDIHLMQNDALRSEEGLAAAVEAIRALQPRPDLMVCGGDLTDPSPNLNYPAANKLLNRFLGIWTRLHPIETHYVFGNHDFVGTKNPLVSRYDSRFGKGLFEKRLGLPRLYYSFEKRGWRFIILDDVCLNPEGDYYAEYKADQLDFVQSELKAHKEKPTVLVNHIPTFSVFGKLVGFARFVATDFKRRPSLVSRNGQNLANVIRNSGANVKLVLAGHLHHQERLEIDGVSYLNGGAICGNWWKGPMMGCPEGFNVIDLRSDGSFKIAYKTYGWRAG